VLDKKGELRECLTWWTADHAIEPIRWRVKGANVPTPQKIRAADDAEALLLESAVEKTDARKEREDKS